jgi:hypothetical protein
MSLFYLLALISSSSYGIPSRMGLSNDGIIWQKMKPSRKNGERTQIEFLF